MPSDTAPEIVGVRMSRFAACLAEVSLEELIYQTCRDLLRDLGLSARDLDHVALASSDMVDGRAISMMVTAGSAAGYGRDVINSSSSGEHALVLSAVRILAGRGRLGLVAAWGKPSEAPLAVGDSLSLDPFYQRALRLERTAFLGLQAARYLARRPEAAADAAAVVERRLASARRNLRSALSGTEATPGGPVPSGAAASGRADDVVAWPLRRRDVPPPTDGAVAMVVATPEVARGIAARRAAIRGLGWASDAYWLGDRDVTRLPALAEAWSTARRRAGGAPPLDVVELSDISPYHEMMVCEALGLSGKDGARVVVNPSGGLRASNPEFGAGLCRVAEAALQVMGQADPCQVNGARWALGHGVAGLGATTHTVVLLEGVA